APAFFRGQPPWVQVPGPCRWARDVVAPLAVVQRRSAAVGDAAAGERRALAGGGGGRVAVYPAAVQRQMARDRRGRAAPAARDAASLQWGGAVGLAAVGRCGGKQVLDAATPRLPRPPLLPPPPLSSPHPRLCSH